MLKPLAQHAVGGGVWRVKWNPLPSRRDDVLVACMHDGFKVVQVQREGDQPRALETAIVNKSHASLAYGADWERDGQQIASASFYDHAARLWDA